MKSASATFITEAAKRSGANARAWLRWRADASPSSFIAASTDGGDQTGLGYQHKGYRIEDLRLRCKLPFPGEPLEFPTLTAQVVKRWNHYPDDSSTLSWFQSGGELYGDSLVGGPLRLEVGFGEGVNENVIAQILTTRRVELSGSPGRLTLEAQSSVRRLMDIFITTDVTYPGSDLFPAPRIARSELARYGFVAGTDYCQTSFDDACASDVTDQIYAQSWVPANSGTRLADFLTRLGWITASTLYVNYLGDLAWYRWRSSTPTPDATLTAGQIVADSFRIYPDFDRVVTQNHFSVLGHVAADYTEFDYYGPSGDQSPSFGSAYRTWSLNYLNTSDSCMTNVKAAVANPFYPLRSGAKWAPHKAEVDVPFGVGCRFQLGDVVVLDLPDYCVPSSLLWRIEELSFNWPGLVWSLVLNDRVTYP